MSMQTKGAYIDRERLSIIWNKNFLKTQEIGLLICIWKNKFADGDVDFATCVDKQGKRYNIALDYIKEIEDDFPV